MKELSKVYSAVAPSATLAVDAKFKQMKADGIPVVGFGAGEPDFDTPQPIKDAAIRAIQNRGKQEYRENCRIFAKKHFSLEAGIADFIETCSDVTGVS